MKRILITGRNSYIGTKFIEWLSQYPGKYKVDNVSLRNDSWKDKDFSNYDTILHLAGIAHVSTDPKMEEEYYKVNRDLTIEVAKKSKEDGVSQFIFMSSIIVYGDGSAKERVIDRNTIPKPSNFYGNSKLQAEEGIKKLETNDFKIAIIRPPMIYGKDSKGNYPRLAKLAKLTPIFPDFDNQRSMLHIDNLCEFIRLMIDNEESGLFFPQNREYVKTSYMVKIIGQVHGKKVILVRWINWLIKMMFNIGPVNKVFGNLVYDKEMSIYEKDSYQIRDFEESIRLTELESK
ncbi:MAG: NAD-dependent epimerase/dehydratase family protein [Epulopiscium sp.]|nr:NAD-dependent epimerase/dehydratase family protein [Candidatus Epulonipiscium sp.]